MIEFRLCVANSDNKRRIYNVRWFYIMIGIVVFTLVSMTPQPTVAQDKTCSKEDAKSIREHPNDTVGYLGITLYSGTIKQDGQYDAVVTAYIGKALRWCRYYDSSVDTNSEAHQLDEWGGRVFVTITADNGSSETLNSFTATGWMPSYGLGAGPKVAVVVEIDPIDGGRVLKGTYVISKTEDGLTNSVIVDGTQFGDQKVYITGVASSYVLDAQGNPLHYLDCPRGSGFRYTLDYDMVTVLDVECNGVSLRADALLGGTSELPENLQDPINPGGGFHAYCTNSNGIQVMGINGEVGYELFVVPNHMIGNGIQMATETGRNVKLGESGIISLWALTTNELQLHTTEPYDFIFSKHRCGDPIPNGAGITIATSSSPLPTELTTQLNVLPASASSLPIYRPSALQLNDDGTYTIRSGDTLNTIAAKLGVDVDELAELNHIVNARYLAVGQILVIPK